MLPLVLAGIVSGGAAFAGVTRTQTIALEAGWNAVFLEVEPTDPTPDRVFAQTPIDIVASHFGSTTPLQFLSDPSVANFKQTGWGIWYAPERPDAFLRTLHAVYGQRAYLIHAASAFQWSVTGAVVPPEAEWRADAYNLVGFGVAGAAAPTYGQFFAGSPAHRHDRIYRLVGESWRRVQNPAAVQMRAGEAFWIYCDGHSSFTGPVAVRTGTQKGLVLGSSPSVVKVANQCGHPLEVTIEHVTSGAQPVPLAMNFRAYDAQGDGLRTLSAKFVDGAWTMKLPVLEAGGKMGIPFEARREDMTEAVQSSLLRVTTDLGTELWLPVAAWREDLQPANGQ